jgi:hypothetical protein
MKLGTYECVWSLFLFSFGMYLFTFFFFHFFGLVLWIPPSMQSLTFLSANIYVSGTVWPTQALNLSYFSHVLLPLSWWLWSSYESWGRYEPKKTI